jgi:O-antigen/teichoic acid export membrane protein
MSGTSIAVLIPANVMLVPEYGPVGAAISYTLSTAAAFLVSVGLAFFLGRGGERTSV